MNAPDYKKGKNYIEKKMKVRTKAVGDDGTALIVFATLSVVDKDEDVIMPGAFGEQLAAILPAHNRSKAPLGKARIFEDANEALAEKRFNLDIENARDWHSAIKFDMADGEPIQEYSFGFTILESSRGEFEGRQVRFLSKLKVHEVSPVLVGAGVNTRTLAVKSGLAKQEDLGLDDYAMQHAKINETKGADAAGDNDKGGASGDLTPAEKQAITFTDQARKALASVQELVDRAKSLANLRAKDGRRISGDSVTQLTQLQGSVKELNTELSVILKDNQQEDVAIAAQKAALEIEQTLRAIESHTK